MINNVKISILIATRNRSSSLARLIDALSAQVDSPPFEVIVGDNGSSDDTPRVVENARAQLKIHYVYEGCPGKGRALNAAFKLAQGNLIVFTDDDVLPHRNWLAQLYATSLKYPEVNIFGGLIEVNFKDDPHWIQRSYNLMGLLTSAHKCGDTDVIYPYGQYPFGPNMAVRRHLLMGTDAPYPEHLGPGTKYPVGDESAFFLQFSSPGAGDRIFTPSAKVFHRIEPHNMTFNKVLHRCYVSGRGSVHIPYSGSALFSDSRSSTWNLIFSRMKSSKSLRELICISARYCGYIISKIKKS